MSFCVISLQSLRNSFKKLISTRTSARPLRIGRPAALGETSANSTSWQRTLKICNEKLSVFAELFTKQCHYVAAQRVTRLSKLFSLYSRMYDEATARHVLQRLGRQFGRRGPRAWFLLGAAVFQWDKEKVTDEEIQSRAQEMHHISHMKDSKAESQYLDSWQCIVDKEQFKLWRKPVPNSYLYQYKVYGTYTDINARSFYNVQTDYEYRKKWDKLVVHLDRVDASPVDRTQVVRWVTYYPYPMYSREYLFVQRHEVDSENNIIVLIARAVSHPACPESDQYVRVTSYDSQMIIKPHTTFDDNGFDYVLTYQDDPQASIPTVAYNWMAKSGIHDFLDKLHAAAKQLHDSQSAPKKGSLATPNTSHRKESKLASYS